MREINENECVKLTGFHLQLYIWRPLKGDLICKSSIFSDISQVIFIVPEIFEFGLTATSQPVHHEVLNVKDGIPNFRTQNQLIIVLKNQLVILKVNKNLAILFVSLLKDLWGNLWFLDFINFSRTVISIKNWQRY